MNRRQFLRLGSAAGALILSAGGIILSEEELWTPTKAIFLPPAEGWVAAPANGMVLVSESLGKVLKSPIKFESIDEFYRMINRPTRYVVTPA